MFHHITFVGYFLRFWQHTATNHSPLPFSEVQNLLTAMGCGHLSYNVLGDNPYMEHLGYLSVGFIFGNFCQADSSNKKQTRQPFC